MPEIGSLFNPCFFYPYFRIELTLGFRIGYAYRKGQFRLCPLFWMSTRMVSDGHSAQDQIESEWVRKIRTDDAAEFGRLFGVYCQPLIGFARRYVRDIPVAENVVQDVFLAVWSNRAQLNPSLKIKTYLYTAVKNQALKHLRHVDVERRGIEQLESAEASVRTPEDEWREKEVGTSIHRAIGELPERCRLIFSMNRFDRLTYAEIANIQDISIKTVETQMGRALRFLRSRLADLL